MFPNIGGSLAKFYKTLKEHQCFSIFHLAEREKTLPNSFNKASIILTPKSGKNRMKQKIVDQFP